MAINLIIESPIAEDRRVAIYKAGLNDPNFDSEKGLDKLISLDKTGKFIVKAGIDWPNFNFKKAMDALFGDEIHPKYIHEAGNRWDTFDSEKGLDALINNKLDISPYYIFYSGLKDKWKNFNYEKGLDALINIDRERSKKIGRYIIGGSIKDAGERWPSFDFKKGLDALIELPVDAHTIAFSGVHWKKFDFKKGFEAMLKKRKASEGIYLVGKYWGKNVPYNILDILISHDKKGQYIFEAGNQWPLFDKKKGLSALRKIEKRYYYRKALKEWPKTASEELNRVGNEIKGIEKAKDKKIVLENSSLKLSKKQKEAVDASISAYNRGLKSKKNNDELLDILIKHNVINGGFVYRAGVHWPDNSYTYSKAFNHLISKGSLFYIVDSGEHWREKRFDYKRGLEALIKKDHEGRYIYLAGTKWPSFDYEKALSSLKKIGGEYYEEALKNWPPTASQILKKIETDAKSISKTKDRKIVLESMILNKAARELKNGNR